MAAVNHEEGWLSYEARNSMLVRSHCLAARTNSELLDASR